MGASIWTLVVVDDGEHMTSIHTSEEEVEAEVRKIAAGIVDGSYEFDEVMEELSEHGVDVFIDEFPLREIAADVSGVDLPLLAEQVAAVRRVLSRCDDDAASTLVTVEDSEAEALEGLLNLAQGLLGGVPR
jgi:cellobiose-specific phosphotransferase system component IIB